MKKWVLFLSLVICASAHAADSSNPYKPTIPERSPETGEGYLIGMPAEVKVQIIMAIRTAGTLQEAAKAIRALAVSNKEFNTVVNDPVVTKGLVYMLVAKFGGYHEDVAKALGTHGAKEYLAINKKFIAKCQDPVTLQQLKALVEAGVDINFEDNHGMTPLEELILFQGDTNIQAFEIIKYVISRGANVNSVSKEATTSLFLAAHHGDIEIVQMLLKSGFDPKLINKKNWRDDQTALHRAIVRVTRPEYKAIMNYGSTKPRADIVGLLLKAGADISIKDRYGHTPLHYARERVRFLPEDPESKKILELLEQAEKDQAAKKQ